MVVTSLLSAASYSLVTMLDTILYGEYMLPQGIRHDINFIKNEFAMGQAVLNNVEDTEELEEHDKNFGDAARELSYDIEDKIDNWTQLLMLHHAYSKSGIKKYTSKFKNLLPVKIPYQIVNDINDIKTQILEVQERRVTDNIGTCSSARTEYIDPRLRTVDTCAADLVGIDGPKYELVKWLRNREDEPMRQQKVVSIVGRAGLGKTTLAKQVYDELGVNFEYRAFVSIPRSCDMVIVLKCILSQFHTQDYSSDESRVPELINQIRDILQDKRYVCPQHH